MILFIGMSGVISPSSIHARTQHPLQTLESDQEFIQAHPSEAQFLIKDFRIEEVKNIQDGYIPEGYPYPSSKKAIYGSLTPWIVVLENIVNLGRSLWQVIDRNIPSADVTQDAAFALPSGISQWEYLDSWSPPVSKVYHVTYYGYFGQKAADFYYRLLFLPGGEYQGKGHYLSNVTVLPADLTVGWGFKFSSQAKVSHVFNAGSQADPIGAIQLRVEWNVNSLFTHRMGSHEFYIRGDGSFQDMSNGS
jgi:hypothetical protein